MADQQQPKPSPQQAPKPQATEQKRKTETKQLQGWKRNRGAVLQRIEQLKRQGVCYICHHLETGEVFAQDPVIYEDDLFRIVLDPFPRMKGQAIIVYKPHREDVAELSDQEAGVVFQMCVRVVRSIKQALGAEKVYVLTMCDGPKNHLNFHLLPRYAGNVMGLKHLISERRPIENGQATAKKIREALLDQADYESPG